MGFRNRFATNFIINKTTHRPRPFSLWSESPQIVSDYTSWRSLTDRTYSGRHLPPTSIDFVNSLPQDAVPNNGNYGQITNLFKRDTQIDSKRSSVLFTMFAQWFTDSVLRIDSNDRRKNTSNHDVDLCQIYGLKESTTEILRTKNLGKLKSQIINGEEYPPYLYLSSGEPKTEFKELPYLEKLEDVIWSNPDFPLSRKAHYYATGLERGNSTIGYTAISTIFLREHNRVCNELHKKYPNWNDERLFQTARNILIVILLKLVVEDYINHISLNSLVDFELEVGFAEGENWYRTNWIALEFDLLYRWHSLVTDNIIIDGVTYNDKEYRVNNELLENAGVGKAIDSLSRQHAGEIRLFNTPNFLMGAEYISIKMGRDYRLKSYNDYREQFGFRRIKDFGDLTDDPKILQSLKSLYANIDQLDFYVGLFAEKSSGNALFGDLMTRMVAVDAFSQIYTNPLLSNNVYNGDTFSRVGLEIIEQTNSIQDLVNRNTPPGSSYLASLSL